MLVHLSVHNYAIVEHLDLELQRGMCVITGETGAGKSIMLDALGLALGDRADSGVVRPGADKADILASFDLDGHRRSPRQWLAERDLDNDGPCILRRVITSEGRSRGYINGAPCPLGDLKALGELLIDIHSQHEHQSLLKPDTHRRLLDAYAGSRRTGAPGAAEPHSAGARLRQELQRLSSSGEEQQRPSSAAQLPAGRAGEPGPAASNELEAAGAGAQGPEQRRAAARRLPPGARPVQRERRRQRASGTAPPASTAWAAPATSRRRWAKPPTCWPARRSRSRKPMAELNRFIDHFDADPQRQQHAGGAPG